MAVSRLKFGRGHADPGDDGGAEVPGGTSRWPPKICKFRADNLQVRGLAGAVKWLEGYAQFVAGTVCDVMADAPVAPSRARPRVGRRVDPSPSTRGSRVTLDAESTLTDIINQAVDA